MKRPPAPHGPEPIEPATSLLLTVSTVLAGVAVIAALTGNEWLAQPAGGLAIAGTLTVLRHLVDRESR